MNQIAKKETKVIQARLVTRYVGKPKTFSDLKLQILINANLIVNDCNNMSSFYLNR